MKFYNTYITTKNFNGQGISGNMVLHEGTILAAYRGYIIHPQGVVCSVTSQNAFDFFSQNDDGKGIERGKLVYDILNRVRKLKKHKERNDIIWNKIWEDSICLKYKRPEHADHWIWNYDFYNADIEDLKYIRNLIIKG